MNLLSSIKEEGKVNLPLQTIIYWESVGFDRLKRKFVGANQMGLSGEANSRAI